MHKLPEKNKSILSTERVKKRARRNYKELGYEIRETERDRAQLLHVFYLSGSLLNHSVEIRRDKINKTCFGARTHIHARVYR